MSQTQRHPGDPRQNDVDAVVARVWRAWSSPEMADAYTDYVAREVLPGMAELPGYLGASYYRRPLDGEVEFLVITRWSSFDAIVGFAGHEAPGRATIPQKAADMLLRYDAEATHYEDVPPVWREGFEAR